ncbi:hypothetical protein FVEG_12303 [Fusarium verticillioides 7600]|uniref:Uncharacterized protein n=1 Tax=Gibberella moniliformis (strain M3125 / FGSC 7600) TaxID=334819 RepID=W7N1E8_GIBM7|nr:hypothetical protein FVEG_12303 [Fusarium verticillioides 7600]EWG53985.1 hypothetical protein FVEG_12303 [Fusarium verticillioides 7600]
MCSQTFKSLLCKACGVKYSGRFDITLCGIVKEQSDWGQCGSARVMPEQEETGKGECTKCSTKTRELAEERRLLDTLYLFGPIRSPSWQQEYGRLSLPNFNELGISSPVFRTSSLYRNP